MCGISPVTSRMCSSTEAMVLGTTGPWTSRIAVAVPGHAADLQFRFEVGGIVHDHFQEQRLVVHGQVADLDRGRQFVPVGLGAEPERFVGDDRRWARPGWRT